MNHFVELDSGLLMPVPQHGLLQARDGAQGMDGPCTVCRSLMQRSYNSGLKGSVVEGEVSVSGNYET